MIFLACLLMAFGVLGISFGCEAAKGSFPNKTQLWDLTVSVNSSINKMRKAWIFGSIAFLVGFVLWMARSFGGDCEFNFLTLFVYPMVAAMAPIPIGYIIGKKKIVEAIEKDKNCLDIGAYDPIKKVDENINNTKIIEIFPNRIVLMDAKNYAFESIVFSEYAVGDLHGKQMVAIACYFLQKYPNVFKRKFNENINPTTATGDSFADTAGSVATLAASVSGQGLVSVKLIRK